MAFMNPNEIKTHPTFENLFPINPEVLARIEAEMKAGNYDDSQSVMLGYWEGQNEEVCIDGHTRIQAAKNAGLVQIATRTKEFTTIDQALEYAIRLQANRRNMKDADILKCVMALDQRRARGGDRRSDEAKSKPQHCGIENSRSASAKYTAELLGISTRKVEQIRTVMDQADPETLEAVQTGKMSINKAYVATQEKRKAEKAAAGGEVAQHVLSPENTPEEADCPNDDEESFQGAEAEDADYPVVDEDTYEDTPDEVVAADKPNHEPHEGTPEDEMEEGLVDAVEDEAEAVPKSNECTNDTVIGTTVALSPDLYQALESLGGCIEVHVAVAIEAYLAQMMQANMDYDPEEEKRAKIAADVACDLAAKLDEEPEEDDDDEYEDEDLPWAQPVITASAAPMTGEVMRNGV